MGANSEQQQASRAVEEQARSEPELVYRTEYEYGNETDGLTVIIVDALADVTDVSPTEIVPRISESVDPDALERVFRPLPDGSRRDGRLTFYLLDFRISLDGNGTVSIYDCR